ncbi:MAG: hypothetical protein L3K03_00625 [Thermoplasmata archaeon]|nr:hypothetical protein [Thermoplasmata archaeon]
MVAKALWVSMLVLGVLAVSGLGFAAFTAQSNVTITGTGGTLSLAVTNWSTETSQSYVGCWGWTSGSNLSIEAAPLAPGDWCEVFANITNAGNVPATVTAWTSLAPGSCFDWVVISPSESGSSTVAPGASIQFQGALGLSSEAGNSCQGAVGNLVVNFDASASTSDAGAPAGL